MQGTLENLAACLEQSSNYRMASIIDKKVSLRFALTQGTIYVGKNAFNKIQNQDMPKGDPKALAEIAGITGAKNCAQWLPLCHPISIEKVNLFIEANEDTSSFTAYCLVVSYDKTGVEMEALTGVNAALLCFYDLTKPVEPSLEISDICLLVKSGGKKGLWFHDKGIPKEIETWAKKVTAVACDLQGYRASLITLSDRASQGLYTDESGLIADSTLCEWQAQLVSKVIIPDDEQKLIDEVQRLVALDVDLIFTLGGTGLAKRDITVNGLTKIFDKPVPSIGEFLRSEGYKHYTSYAYLSQSTAGIVSKTLIIALPGSPKAVKENLAILAPVLPAYLLSIQNQMHQGHTATQEKQ